MFKFSFIILFVCIANLVAYTKSYGVLKKYTPEEMVELAPIVGKDRAINLDECPKGTSHLLDVRDKNFDLCVDKNFNILPYGIVNNYRRKIEEIEKKEEKKFLSMPNHTHYAKAIMNVTLKKEKNFLKKHNIKYGADRLGNFTYILSSYFVNIGHSGTLLSASSRIDDKKIINQILVLTETEIEKKYAKLTEKFNKKYELKIDKKKYKVYYNDKDVIILQIGCNKIPKIMDYRYSICHEDRALHIIYQTKDLINAEMLKKKKEKEIKEEYLNKKIKNSENLF